MCEKHAKSAMKFQPNVDKALALTQQTNLPQSAPTSGATSQTRARKMSSFTKKKIDWLWDARIPFRTLTTVSGDPDQGKSLLTLYIAAQLSKGEPMYGDDEINVPPSDTLLLVAEDDPESTLLPRLEAAGADTDRVHLLESVMLNGKGETIGERLAQLDTDLQNIMDVLNANLNIRLVIIDPISSFLGNTSMNKEQEVRRVLNPLLREAQKRKIAVLLVVHFNKNSETRSAMDRVGGAKALVGLGRAAWTCVSEPKQETEDGEPMPLDGVDRHLFLKLKGNLAPSSLGGLVYALTSRPIEVEAEDGLKVMADTPYVQWIGKTESTAQEVVINGQAKPAGRRFEKVDAVSKWLRGFLDKTNGAAWSADILEAGAARGYSERTLRRYLTEKLHGDIRRVGMETQWVLPGAQLLPHKTVAMPGADAVSDDAIPAEQPEAIPDVIGEAVPTPKKKTRTPRKKRNTVALDVEPETVTSEAAAPLDDLVAPLAGLVEPASQPIMAGDPGAGSEAF